MTEAAADFALLGHPDGYEHLGEVFLHSRPDYGRERIERYRATLSRFFAWTPSYAARTPLLVESPSGRRARGRLVVCTFLPEALASPRGMRSAAEKTRQGCRVASELGARVVALGGFTSIAGGAQGARLAREFGLAVTSGNSLTAALTVAQLEALLERLGRRAGDLSLAVIGASGDVGRACTLALAPRVRRTLLVARNAAKLEALRDALPRGVEAEVATEVAHAAEADLVVAATSSPVPLLDEARLRPGSIVCDVGYPKNLAHAAAPRPDVLVFAGGIAELPVPLDIQYHTRLPSPRLLYGCFAEGIVLALAGRAESYSTGQGRIDPGRMAEILELARAEGIRPAPPHRGTRPLDDAALEAFAAHQPRARRVAVS